MEKFSERMNITSPPAIQLGSMNDDLQNVIWNFIFGLITMKGQDKSINYIGKYLYKVPSHLIPSYGYEPRDWLWDRYKGLEWYEVYDLLEFVVQNAAYFTDRDNRQEVMEGANKWLERECSGYRFIQGMLTPISEQVEVEAIEDAMSKAESTGLVGVRTHIESATRLFGKKPEPEYRNSIKESISAVESAAKAITGIEHGGLDAALEQLARATNIHPRLKEGFLKLYVYSSSKESGIRHAILEQPTVGFDEAKFMLVACSAAAHFLIAKADESGLLKQH